MADAAASPLTPETVLAAVAESMNAEASAEFRLDTPIVVDSFALVWLQHLLEEKHDLVIDPQYADLQNFSTPQAIYDYIRAHHPDRTGTEAEPAPAAPREEFRATAH
ncbi:acyl carrier protein [Streptomyces actinomycinicus]|uniref:Acyl carrier protein n=1 Tax=Streptomyces actinomycinicus TaxID=1695166 RepID=A0A937JTA2_9ACTN|nr:acyl carrier protein [Streptomyces actinomycinicus]MBL1086548.1 acyl carrier protein [Streptomyces actinomycinicus]